MIARLNRRIAKLPVNLTPWMVNSPPADLFFGNASDGDTTLAGTTTQKTFFVSSLMANSAAVFGNPDFGPGDEVILINTMGTSSKHANVGNYEFLTVQNIAGSTVYFTGAKTKTYGADEDDLIGMVAGANQFVMLQKVPHYNQVTIDTGVTATVPAWSLTAPGGIMAFRCKSITNNGIIDVTAKGYCGRASIPSAPVPGIGPAYDGLIGSGACTAGYVTWSDAARERGSCGSHSTLGSFGSYWDHETVPAGVAPGSCYGVPDLSQIFFGASGGGSTNYNRGDHWGTGGTGGGIIIIFAETGSFGAVKSNGGQGVGGWWHGGAGAGGSILLGSHFGIAEPSKIEVKGATMWTNSDGGYGRCVTKALIG